MFGVRAVSCVCVAIASLLAFCGVRVNAGGDYEGDGDFMRVARGRGEDVDSLELKLLTYKFFNAFEEFLNGEGETEFVEADNIMASDVLFCESSLQCSNGVDQVYSFLSSFQDQIDISFTNLKFLGVNPTFDLRPVAVLHDELFDIVNGCKAKLPKRVSILYFNEYDLVTQYHVVDNDEEAIIEFFEKLEFNEEDCKRNRRERRKDSDDSDDKTYGKKYGKRSYVWSRD